MKKVISILILTIIMLVGQIIPVNADMGAPVLQHYQVRVSNKNGAKLYNTDDGIAVGLVPYGEILTIYYEYDIKGTMYGEVYFEEDEQEECEDDECENEDLEEDNNYYDDDSSYYVKLSDVTTVKDELTLDQWLKEHYDAMDPDESFEEFKKGEKNHKELYVFRSGAYLYKGPAIAYKKASSKDIPVGTVISFDYSDIDEMWAYVTYNGVSGWLYIYPYEDLTQNNTTTSVTDSWQDEETFVLSKDVAMYDETFKKKLNVTIPKNTKLSTKITYQNTYRGVNHYAQVEYEGKKGWIKLTENNHIFETTKEATGLTVSKIKIYKSRDFSSKVLKTTKVGEEFKILTSYPNDWYYVEYKGTKGYANADFGKYEDFGEKFLVSLNTYVGSSDLFKTKKETIFYDKINGKKNGKKLEEGKETKVKYWRSVCKDKDDYTCDNPTVWYYVEGYGWTKTKLERLEGKQEPDPIETPDLDPDPVEEKEPTKEEEKEKIETPTPITTIALYAVCGAIILSLVTFVTIKLINKKKKGKVEEPKENSMEEISTDSNLVSREEESVAFESEEQKETPTETTNESLEPENPKEEVSVASQETKDVFGPSSSQTENGLDEKDNSEN